MSKKHVNVSERVMSRIDREKIAMKPRWYFVAGAVAMTVGLIGSGILSMFLVSLISFTLRTHGPMGGLRYQQLLSSFPWWAPIIALAGVVTGIRLLHAYDFSYKKNFISIILVFITAIILSGWLIDYIGIDALWAGRGPMKRFYQQYDGGWRGGNGNRINQNNPMFRESMRGTGQGTIPSQQHV